MNKNVKPIDLSHCSIHGLNCEATGMWKITLKTQELSPADVTALSTALQEGNQITTRVKPVIEGSKSPAERLKGVLFKIYKENNVEGDFEDYYRKEMELVISHFKTKLP